MRDLPLFQASVATFIIAAFATSSALAASAATSATKTYCTPLQKCWPKAADWASFNQTIGGHLIAVKNWQDPCFVKPNGFNLAACTAVKLGYTDGLVGDCTLNADTLFTQLNPLPVTDRTCQLGRISPYAVDVSSPQDIRASLAFAKRFNIKVTIKNTGHEYLGRGTYPDTLMLWTHHLTSLSYDQASSTVTVGAGVTADMAYRFAASKGKDITLGAYGSVGIGGGFAQGGGHGPLQPKYGLAVDNILSYQIVTADGTIRTASAKSDPLLFYALRGGGGGVWGVVTQVVYKVYPSSPIVAVVYNLTINPLSSQKQKLAAIADFTTNQAKYEVGWRKQGWSGYTFMNTANILFSHFLPTSDLVNATAQMTDFSKYVLTNTQWVVNQQMILLYPNFEAVREIIFKLGEPQTPVGFNERLAGRLIPVSAYSTAASRTKLGQTVAAALGSVSSSSGFSASDLPFRAGESIQLYSTGPLPAQFGGPSGEDTGVNPAWRDSIWEVIQFTNYLQGMSQTGRNLLAKKVTKSYDGLRKYGTGCYYSEADVLEPNWQTAFFGANYPKLLDIKRQYDPANMFTVYKGIGYQGQENQAAFKCYEQA